MRSSLRVVVLEPAPRSGGGSEAMTLAIARALRAAGATLHLLHEHEGDLVDDYLALGAGKTRMRLPLFTRRAPVQLATGLSGMARELRRLDADLMLTSHLGFIRQAALLRAMTSIPALFHLGLPSIGGDRLLRWSYRRIGLGVAPARAIADGWQADGWPAAQLEVVPNWIDTRRFRPLDRAAQRAALELSPDTTCIVSVGRKSRDKGTLDLLHAFARVAEQHAGVRLLLVGPVGDGFAGDLDAAMSALEPAVRNRVQLEDTTTHPERWYAAADIACSASHTEAFGLAVAEAMACGLPVVATDTGASRALLGEGVSLVAPGDADALAAALGHRLSETPALRCAHGTQLREKIMAHDAAQDAGGAYVRLAERLVRGATA